MTVIVADYVRRRSGETFCARCGERAREPFATRGPCECGSNAWTTGRAMSWPPMVPAVAPAFLYPLSIPPMVNLEPPLPNANSVSRRGGKNGRAKLDEASVAAIRRMSRAGRSIRKIAKLYHVGRRTIEELLVGNTWRDE